MAQIDLSDGEQYLAEFSPPKNAAIYHMITRFKDAPISFLILVGLFYLFFKGLYAFIFIDKPHPVEAIPKQVLSQMKTGPQTLQAPQGQLAQVKQTVGSCPEKEGSAQSYSFSYNSNSDTSFGSAFPTVKKAYLLMLAALIALILALKIRKSRRLLSLISFTLTNKRIVISKQRDPEAQRSIYFNRQKYCFIDQTVFHRLFHIYYLFFSSLPNAWASPFGRKGERVEGLVDMLSKDQAEVILKLFNNSLASPGEIKEKTIEMTMNNRPTATQTARPSDFNPNATRVFQPSYGSFFVLVFQLFFFYAIPGMLAVLVVGLNVAAMLFVEALKEWVGVVMDFIIKNPQQAFLDYILFFIFFAIIMAFLKITLTKYTFTKTELIITKWPRLIPKKWLPNKLEYKEIVNVMLIRSFKAYHVHVLGPRNIRLKLEGLSKKNADKIVAFLSRNL